MSNFQPKIKIGPFRSALILESPDPSLDRYLKTSSIKPYRIEKFLNEDEIIREVNEKKIEIIFKRSKIKISEKIIQNCPSLYAIQLCSIGTDSVDLKACAKWGVLVFNDPVSNGRSVTELALGQLLALARRLYEANELAHRGVWDKTAKERWELQGKVLGIIGLGNIGRQVARLAEKFGMEIQFYDNRPVAVEVGREMGWKPADSLEQIFRTSDCITVHTSAHDYRGKDNSLFLDPYLHLLGRDRGENSPRLFLNLARGNLHSAEALLSAVKSGQIRRAAVDVYPNEPGSLTEDWKNPYAGEKRIVCSPHIGAATLEAQPRIAQRVSKTMIQFSKLGSLRDCVFAPKTELSLSEDFKNKAILAVVHSTVRGTKKAIDDAIFNAGASNLSSVHRDFAIGIAYDLSLLDRPLTEKQLRDLVSSAQKLTGEERAILSVRQMTFDSEGNIISL